MGSNKMNTLIRIKDVMAMTGAKKATIYAQMAEGVLPRPIKLSRKFACWPQHEISQLINARIAGWSEDKIKTLVAGLMEARKSRA
jgi:prophage regulatory protein